MASLDDIGYLQQERDEMEVLITFLAERYENRSVAITTNLVFYEWERIFKHPMTTMAALDRVVRHSVILDMMGLESYRARAAQHQQHTEEGGEASEQSPAAGIFASTRRSSWHSSTLLTHTLDAGILQALASPHKLFKPITRNWDEPFQHRP